MHLTRFAFFKLNWYHINAAPRRHFENNCTMSASWYWSHEIWFTNMFTLWYRRSFEKLYCNKESKKPIFFNVGFSFWIFFNVGIFFSFWDICLSKGVFLITSIAIRVGDLRLYINDEYGDEHLDERLICSMNALSCDFYSLRFNLHFIYSISFESLFEICLNSAAARFLSCDVNEI